MSVTHLAFDLPFVVKRVGHNLVTGMSSYCPRLNRDISTGYCKIGLSTVISTFNEVSKIRDLKLANVYLADENSKSFRFGIYPKYKANRYKKKQTFLEKERSKDVQFCKRLLSFIAYCLGVDTYSKFSLEADDVCGKLVLDNLKERFYFFTADSDWLQLLMTSEQRMVVKDGYEFKFYNHENIGSYGKHGMPGVENFYDLLFYKCTVGDSADCYPGLPGIGPKAFESFMGELKKTKVRTLQLLVSPNMIPKLPFEHKLKQKYIEHTDLFNLSYKLARFRTNESIESPVPYIQLNDLEDTKIFASRGQAGLEVSKKVLLSYGMVKTVNMLEQFYFRNV